MKKKYIIEVDESEIIEYWNEEGVKEIGYQEYALKSCPNIKVKPYEERTQEWIPVTYRPMTDEEEKEFCKKWDIKEGSLEDWEKRVFTCHLPDDGQEILISVGRYVHEDICSYDEYGCGLENNGDWEGIDAWMPLPEPYKKEGDQ